MLREVVFNLSVSSFHRRPTERLARHSSEALNVQVVPRSVLGSEKLKWRDRGKSRFQVRLCSKRDSSIWHQLTRVRESGPQLLVVFGNPVLRALKEDNDYNTHACSHQLSSGLAII